MFTPAYVDSKTITQADGAQNSRVPVPLPDDPYVAPLGSRVSLVSEEFEAFEPSGTRTNSSHSSDSTTPLLPNHPLTHVSPTSAPTYASFYRKTAHMTVHAQLTMSLGHSARVADAMALSDSAFRRRSDYEDRSLDDKGRVLEGEGLSLEEEEAVPEGQQEAVPVVDTAMSGPLRLGYGALRRYPEDDRVYIDIPIYPPVAPVQTLLSLEWLSGAQLELHESILHNHTQRLDALPPTLIANIDKDVRELYTRSGVLETRSSHRGQTDSQRAALWHAIYDTQRENHDLRMQLAKERCERLELAIRIAGMERRQESREEYWDV
uniref:Uncharacterized protein n=1 Tax=Tanacetum cinerariifolium TaxID=118510 RepID=A0A699HDV7_TANCI|nr:hypothetical protein [Tanacetum cinerariifolium]